MTNTMRAAVEEYLRRQTRNSHPRGRCDGARRWYPDPEAEEQECCSDIRSPSAAWPFSLMLHCRTIGHVAALSGVDVRDLRRAVRHATDQVTDPEIRVLALDSRVRSVETAVNRAKSRAESAYEGYALTVSEAFDAEVVDVARQRLSAAKGLVERLSERLREARAALAEARRDLILDAA